MFLHLSCVGGDSLKYYLGKITWTLIHKSLQRTHQFDFIDRSFCLVVYSIKFLSLFSCCGVHYGFSMLWEMLKCTKHVHCICCVIPFKCQPHKMVKNNTAIWVRPKWPQGMNGFRLEKWHPLWSISVSKLYFWQKNATMIKNIFVKQK